MSSDLRTDEDALLVLADLLAPDQSEASGSEPVEVLPRPQAYVVLPNLDRPRYVLPANAPAAAAAHLRTGSGAVGGLVAHAVARPAIRAGALRLAYRRTLTVPAGTRDHPTLADRISHELGLGPLAVSVAIGPPRPNRKPVIRLTDGRGRAVAWAKVGTSTHAAALVRHEDAFLTGPGPISLRQAGIDAPTRLAQFTWKGHPVVAVSALPARVGVRVRTLPLTAEAITAIANCDSVDEAPGPAVDSSWWKQVETELADVTGPRRRAAGRAAEAVFDQLRHVELRYGRWHGDLASWNAQWHDRRLLVWDWERTGDAVPVGFDALHESFQFHLFNAGLPVAAARQRATHTNRDLLRELGVPAAAAGPMTAGYCLTFALRLLEDARLTVLDPAAAEVLDAVLADLGRMGAE